MLRNTTGDYPALHKMHFAALQADMQWGKEEEWEKADLNYIKTLIIVLEAMYLHKYFNVLTSKNKE